MVEAMFPMMVIIVKMIVELFERGLIAHFTARPR
jgi:hypothetical protein